MTNYRKAVYQALLSCYREEGFLSQHLQEWKQKSDPSERDFHLAYEIAMGTVRYTWALDAIAKQLAKSGKLHLKLKEKILVRMALYQALYLDSMPLYAVADQMVKLAKAVCHPRFIPFFNALMHQLDGFTWEPPKSNSIEDLSVRVSFPEPFVEWMLRDYGPDAESIMNNLNQVHPSMMRVRKGEIDLPVIYSSNMGAYVTCPDVKKWGQNSRVYIQNVTPGALIDKLSKGLPHPPTSILDMCAAPGGKTIALHDAFPEAELWANEKSPKRLETLKDNLKKYEINAHLSSEDGLEYSPSRHFDLIILDVPCSNTGVLSKKPEARLRLTEEHVDQLKDLQLRLLKHAAKFLKKDGQIWYMTCSILKDENEALIRESGLQCIGEPITILPNKEGWDGGFGAALRT
ncbi:MAG: methyltransferase [Chlamydiales bacterium]|nr:methyltransferase [Chlamydiales bacterium]